MPLDDLLVGARFAASLPVFLHRPVSLAEARAHLARRLSRRADDFLSLVRRAVYPQPNSPYYQLLRLAGCELGDLERLVQQEGLEGALQALLERGVYLTVDEFKGRRPAIRGSASLLASPERLHNPSLPGQVLASSGASRGAGTTVPMNFTHLRDRAVDTLLVMAARGGDDWVKAHWHVPGGGVLARLLEFSAFGSPVSRWFSQVDPGAAGLHPGYRWSARALRWGSLLALRPLPAPEYVPLDNPRPILEWIDSARRAGRVAHLFTFASSAVRLSQAAQAAGQDLAGLQLTVTGEPLTAARLAAIRGAGAEVSPRYAVTECGAVGFGCLAPAGPDDVHLPADLHALIQVPPAGGPGELPGGALLLTSLRPSTPFIMLNVSMGDRAEVSQPGCGCPLQRLGWPTHLANIRSFEKLTAAGMTFHDADVIRVLEQVLPARFGGGPTDYQLLEEEEASGRPRLSLLVHPGLGPLDPSALVSTVLSELGADGGTRRVMSQLWREAGLLRVERAVPRTTPAGKILHLHQTRGIVSVG